MTTRQAVWFLALGETFIWAGLYYIFPALIVRWETEFGWSKAELTGALTLSIITSALISPLAGRLIDKGYGPHLLAGGGFVGGLFLASLAFVDSLSAFYAVWIGLGACMGCCLYDPCFSFVIRTRGMEAKRDITIITLLAGLAGTISFPLSHLISDLAGWRYATLSFAVVICLVAAPLMWIGAQRLAQGSLQNTTDDISLPPTGWEKYQFLLGAKFWLLAVCFTLLYMNHVALVSHLLLLLKERQFDADTAILAATFIGPMQVLGRMSMIVAERYVSNMSVGSLCFIFVILGNLALMASGEHPSLLALFIILQGSGIGVVSIIRPILNRDILGGENFGLKAGALSVPYQIGSACAALIGSLIWAIGGYDLVLKTLLLAPVMGLFLFWLASILARKS